MKVIIKIALVIVVVVVSIAFLIDKNLNTEENEKYIKSVLVDDFNLRNEYGVIKKYSVKKVGKSSVGANTGGYNYYNVYVSGERKSGMIVIKIFKNEKGEVLRYDIKL